MKNQKSAGAIVFRREEGKIYYLLLDYGKHWEFSKGMVEQGETDEQTTLREIKEETGLVVELVQGFKESIKYFYFWEGQKISKTVIFFLAEAKSKDVTISHEHKGFQWLEFKEAMENITFKNSKDILEKADKFLNGEGKLKKFI